MRWCSRCGKTLTKTEIRLDLSRCRDVQACRVRRIAGVGPGRQFPKLESLKPHPLHPGVLSKRDLQRLVYELETFGLHRADTTKEAA